MKKCNKIIEIIKIDFLLNYDIIIINDSTGHGVHNIIIYNDVSHNLQFHFLDITHFVGIYEYIS